MPELDPSALADLERHVADTAAAGAPRFVLVLGDDAVSMKGTLDALPNRAAARGVFVPVPDGSAPFAERAFAALVARLSERRAGRPGVAPLVDPLIAKAAE